MIPNLLGTEFRQLDHRVDPRDPDMMDYVKEKGKNELAAVVYEVNVMGRWGEEAEAEAGGGGGVYLCLEGGWEGGGCNHCRAWA